MLNAHSKVTLLYNFPSCVGIACKVTVSCCFQSATVDNETRGKWKCSSDHFLDHATFKIKLLVVNSDNFTKKSAEVWFCFGLIR